MARKQDVSPPVVREYAPCSVDGCKVGALIRKRTSTGWADFCPDHYELWHMRRVRSYLQSRGLERKGMEPRDLWLERMREFRKAKMGDVGKMRNAAFWDAQTREILQAAESGKRISPFVLERYRAYAERRQLDNDMRDAA